MAKKHKPEEAPRLDEVERTMYSTFCTTANSLSQIYTQAMAQQTIAFKAGERHALEKLYQWIMRHHEEGLRVTTAEIVSYLQDEIDYGGGDSLVSPASQVPLQHLQSAMHSTNLGIQPSGLSGQAAVSSRTSQIDQTKNLVFSNALSNPVHRNLQPYHLAQGGEYFPSGVLPSGFGSRNNEVNIPNQGQDSNGFSSNDSSMDMHPDSPLS